MKILIIGGEVSNSKSRFPSIVAEWAKEREIEVEFIPCVAQWDEPIINTHKGPNKLYYRKKERW